MRSTPAKSTTSARPDDKHSNQGVVWAYAATHQTATSWTRDACRFCACQSKSFRHMFPAGEATPCVSAQNKFHDQLGTCKLACAHRWVIPCPALLEHAERVVSFLQLKVMQHQLEGTHWALRSQLSCARRLSFCSQLLSSCQTGCGSFDQRLHYSLQPGRSLSTESKPGELQHLQAG